MSSSLANKISHSLSACLFRNGFPYRFQALHHCPLRFASSVASAAYARQPYKPKPKPVQQSATKTPQKVPPPPSSSLSYSKKLNEKPKTTNNETLSSSVVSEDKPVEKSSKQEVSDEEWEDDPEWFKNLEMDEDPSAQDLPELEMDGVDWQKIRPTEYRNGEIVYKIIDNPGEKKITLLRECENGERIKVSAKMPEDGNNYNDRCLHTFVRVKKGNECQNFSTFSKSWMEFYTEKNQLSEHAVKSDEQFLRVRGIDESLAKFLKEYMIKKFLKEKLFPNIKNGW